MEVNEDKKEKLDRKDDLDNNQKEEEDLNKNKEKEEIKNIINSINKFIDTYEKESLYINFIEKEGYKTYIKNKYDTLFENQQLDNDLYDKDYKTIDEFRDYLLQNDNIDFIYYDNEKEKK